MQGLILGNSECCCCWDRAAPDILTICSCSYINFTSVNQVGDPAAQYTQFSPNFV